MTIKLRTRSGKHLHDEFLDFLEEIVALSAYIDGTPKEVSYHVLMDYLGVVSIIWEARCKENDFWI